MEDVSVAQAKEHLEELISRAARGEEVQISDPALGTVRLQSVRGPVKQRPKRLSGHLAGQFKVPEDLFGSLPEDELRRWTGVDS